MPRQDSIGEQNIDFKLTSRLLSCFNYQRTPLNQEKSMLRGRLIAWPWRTGCITSISEKPRKKYPEVYCTIVVLVGRGKSISSSGNKLPLAQNTPHSVHPHRRILLPIYSRFTKPFVVGWFMMQFSLDGLLKRDNTIWT